MLVATLVAAAVTTLVLVALVATRDDDARRQPTNRPDRDACPRPTPPRALLGTPGEDRSSRGRTSSMRSTEHRRRGSSSPSAPGGRTSSTGRAIAKGGAGTVIRGRHRLHRVQPIPTGVSQTPATGAMGSPGACDDRRRSRRRAQRAAGMGRRDRPVGHLRRRLPRQRRSNAPPPPTSRTAPPCTYGHDEARRRLVATHSEAGRTQTTRFGGSYYEPGQIETLWSSTSTARSSSSTRNLWPGPSAADHAEFAAVLDSIRIDRAMSPAHDVISGRSTRR